jgi:hypothetical protein
MTKSDVDSVNFRCNVYDVYITRALAVMSTTTRSTRLSAAISSTLLIAGSILFVVGGGQHPRAGTAFGTPGTPEFFRAFADHIHHQESWVGIHVLILIGPVLWSLALPRRRADEAPPDGWRTQATRTLDSLASRTLLLGAGLWAMTFVFDGFVAPLLANGIASATPNELPGLLASFRSNQDVVISLGLVSWVLVGAAMAMVGTATVLAARALSVRAALGVAGVIIGVWPIVAAITGEFDPGPFTSRFWNVTALVSAFWFAAYGFSLMSRERLADVSSERNAPPTLGYQA